MYRHTLQTSLDSLFLKAFSFRPGFRCQTFSTDKLIMAGDKKLFREMSNIKHCKVKYTSICIAHFYAKRLKCAQTWITQFYLQITPCLPLLPCRRTSPPVGWYSFYRPTEGRRLSRPGWLVTYRNKVLGVRVRHILNVTHQGAARDAASVRITRTDTCFANTIMSHVAQA